MAHLVAVEKVAGDAEDEKDEGKEDCEWDELRDRLRDTHRRSVGESQRRWKEAGGGRRGGGLGGRWGGWQRERPCDRRHGEI